MQTKYVRCKNKIQTIETKETRTFDSINLAKKESRRLQLAEENGGLGFGCLIKLSKLINFPQKA